MLITDAGDELFVVVDEGLQRYLHIIKKWTIVLKIQFSSRTDQTSGCRPVKKKKIFSYFFYEFKHEIRNCRSF